MMSMVKLLPRAVVAVFYALSVGFLALMWIWASELPPTRIDERTLLTPEVARGGSFKLRVHVFRDRHCAASVHRSFVDSDKVETKRVPEDYAAMQTGDETRVVEIPVPDVVKPGKVEYRASVHWMCNPLQHYFPTIVDYPVVTFTLLP